MTRDQFRAALARGLYGLPQARIDEILADYDQHFRDGEAAGRGDADIAAALGDPERLARELKAEAGFRRWEQERSAGSLAGVIMALLGLATFDIIFLLPFLCMLAAIFMGMGGTAIGLFVGGTVLSLLALFPGMIILGISGHLGGAVAMLLAGIGLLAGGVGLAALLWLAVNFIARALVEYARLHFRLIDRSTI